ncbi:MAG: hypothetical protein ACIAQF_00515 [Phycisphaerales bacterium JB065]
MTVCFGWGVRAAAAVLVSLTTCSVASAGAFVYDEGVDGDLSNDWLAPTQFPAFGVGQSVATMSVFDSNESTGDRDYFTITVPAGLQLDSITLLSLESGGNDSVAFFGIQVGNQVTVDPNSPNPAPLLGWMLTQESNVGGDILEIAIGEGNSPLGDGQYSFWVQQTGPEVTTLSFGFNLSQVPTPSGVGLAGLAMLGAMRRRR